jgi:hypothetical protein
MGSARAFGAMGYYAGHSVKQSLALHWDGSGWGNSRFRAELLREVWAIGPGNVRGAT